MNASTKNKIRISRQTLNLESRGAECFNQYKPSTNQISVSTGTFPEWAGDTAAVFDTSYIPSTTETITERDLTGYYPYTDMYDIDPETITECNSPAATIDMGSLSPEEIASVLKSET